MKRIGSDCDGIVADFSKMFSTILRELYGNHLPILTDKDIPNWDWHKFLPITEEQIDEAWNRLYLNPNAWYDLDLVINQQTWHRFVEEIGKNKEIDTYFITSRKNSGGISAAQQTWKWLLKHGWPHPHVIADKNKGEICRALNLEYFIDDSGKNCLDIVEKSPSTKCYMLDCLHNHKINHPKIRRIYDLNEFIDDVKLGK